MRTWLLRSRAWIAIVILIPFSIAALNSKPIVYEETIWDFAIDLVAWTVFIAGGTFRWWATLYIGGNKDGILATEGPYSLVRNPLYLGTILLASSIAIFLHSLEFAGGLAVASCVYLGITIPTEERRLYEIFGEEYSHYCKDVPRLCPRIRWPISPRQLEVNLSGVFAESIRTARWIWIPMVSEAFAHLRSVGTGNSSLEVLTMLGASF